MCIEHFWDVRWPSRLHLNDNKDMSFRLESISGINLKSLFDLSLFFLFSWYSINFKYKNHKILLSKTSMIKNSKILKNIIHFLFLFMSNHQSWSKSLRRKEIKGQNPIINFSYIVYKDRKNNYLYFLLQIIFFCQLYYSFFYKND